MDEKLTWKGEIEFRGTAEDYNKLSAALELTGVSVSGVEWWDKHRWAGLWPVPIWVLLDMDRIEAVVNAAGAQNQLRLTHIRGIRGGIREPHLHLQDEVALINRQQFKQLMIEAAGALAAKRVDAGLDYQSTVTPIVDMVVNT